MSAVLVVAVPGVPRRQPRHKSRAIPVGGGKWSTRAYEPEEAKTWKGELRIRYERAVIAEKVPLPFFAAGPVAMIVACSFPLAKSNWKKRDPVPRAWKDTAFGGDWDNLGKLYSDAGNGLLFTDDGQVCAGIVLRVIAAQGEAPSTEVRVMRPEALPVVLARTFARALLCAARPMAPAAPVTGSLFAEDAQ